MMKTLLSLLTWIVIFAATNAVFPVEVEEDEDIDDAMLARCVSPTKVHDIILPAACDGLNYNVGSCYGKNCRTCKSGRTCCVPADYYEDELSCDLDEEYEIILQVATKCHCQPCDKPTVTITGRLLVTTNLAAEGAAATSIAGADIFIDGMIATTTEEFGYFSFQVDKPENGVLVLYIEGGDQEYLAFPKILRVGRASTVNYDIYMENRPTAIDISDPTQEINVELGDASERLLISGGGIVDNDGNSYEDPVKLFVKKFSTNRGTSTLPSELFAWGEDGPQMLSSRGMFFAEAYTDDLNTKLTITQASYKLLGQTELPASDIGLQMLTLNMDTGLFEDNGNDFEVDGEDLVYDIGELTELENLDIILPYYCWLKVGLYSSDDYVENLVGGVVTAVYFDDSTGEWTNFISVPAEVGTGATVPIPCDNQYSIATKVEITADYFGEALIVPQSNPADADQVGVNSDTLSKLMYKRADHDSGSVKTSFTIMLPDDQNIVVDNINGPIFDTEAGVSRTLDDSEHFHFYPQSPLIMEVNRVYVDENNIFDTWTDDEFSWWPSLDEFHACYAKVHIATPTTSRIIGLSGSLQDDDSVIAYGLREIVVKAANNVVKCVEYKCPTEDERTYVSIFGDSDNEVERCSINTDLLAYLDLNDPIDKSDTSKFAFKAPREPEESWGIYEAVSALSPVDAKTRALNMCNNAMDPPAAVFNNC